MKTQVDIENENLQLMITKGTNDLLKAKDTGTIAELKQSGAVLPYYIGELANKLKMYSELVMLGKAKVKSVPAKMLTILDPVVVAHYTVNALISSIGRQTNFTKVSNALAHKLETEYRITLLKENDDKVYQSFIKMIQGTSYKNDRQFQITNDLLTKFHKEISTSTLSFHKLSAKALLLLAECQPIVKNQIVPPICFITEKLGVETNITTAKWLYEWLFDMVSDNDGAILTEYHTPLIEKPLEWEGLYGGGFHTARFKYPLIKTKTHLNEYDGLPRRTIQAVNRLQNTKWRVNKRILEVLSVASNNDFAWGDLPTTYSAKIHLTPIPHGDIDNAFLTEEQKADRKIWRKQSAPHYEEQESRNSKVLAVKRVLIEANRFKDYESIYFSYFCDFRGRIYPKASNLQPQGADFVKALLEFTEGKPIDTEEAETYFFMHGANTFGNGLEKKTLAEKRQWVLSNSHKIRQSAKNPYALDGIWREADEEPWLFLAFCFEFNDWYDDRTNYLSHISIAFDGSCNGLQHLSAILLDEIGGEAVNLTSKLKKQDIYDVVRDKTENLLKLNSEPLATDLLKFSITRKACKRPVMIVPYAGTQRACRRYIEEQITKEGAKEFFGDNFQAALTLYTKTVWEAISLVIVKGREVMAFLKGTTGIIIDKSGGNTITWRTPNGFEVKQKITKDDHLKIRTPLGNTVKERGYIENLVRIQTEVCNRRKHGTAIAPNLIHSLDACHLQETVNGMPDGTSFAMIHDSYGTHAKDAGLLNDTLRMVFYELYYTGEYLGQWLKEQGVDIPPPPKGTLDLSLVLNDEFFFS